MMHTSPQAPDACTKIQKRKFLQQKWVKRVYFDIEYEKTCSNYCNCLDYC